MQLKFLIFILNFFILVQAFCSTKTNYDTIFRNNSYHQLKAFSKIYGDKKWSFIWLRASPKENLIFPNYLFESNYHEKTLIKIHAKCSTEINTPPHAIGLLIDHQKRVLEYYNPWGDRFENDECYQLIKISLENFAKKHQLKIKRGITIPHQYEKPYCAAYLNFILELRYIGLSSKQISHLLNYSIDDYINDKLIKRQNLLNELNQLSRFDSTKISQTISKLNETGFSENEIKMMRKKLKPRSFHRYVKGLLIY